MRMRNWREAIWKLLSALLLAVLGTLPLKAVREGKTILVGLSWGDQVAFVASTKEKPLNTAARFEEMFREYKAAGVDTVLFRLDVLRWVRDYDWPEPRLHYRNAPPEVLEADEKQWKEAHRAVKEGLLKAVVKIAHENGLKIYAYSTTFDEGIPLNKVWYAADEYGGAGTPHGEPVMYHGNIYGPLISKFTENHPEYVMVDRSQKDHNWGTLQFAYPEARAYVVNYNRRFLELYPFDGIYIDFRDEFSHPAFADEFGFAPPIVKEYQERYGVNILHQQFDLEKWRRLQGEYLTQFIRELHTMVHAKGKKLIVGIPQGNYLGLPVGNMYVDWQGWVKTQLVDGLVIGVISGEFLFPDRIGYGYLTDMESGIGLPNLLWDIQNNYWPLCAKYGVKLYAHPLLSSTFRGVKIPLPEMLKTNVDGIYTGFSAVEKIPR